mgnify:FL=1|tara:strand:- start:450 stop:587 length:138 start_codon:yes stop_codon:yes gene_type:complete
MDKEKEIKKYEEQAEKLKSALYQCLGVIQYLKSDDSKEKDKKEGK